MEWYTLTKKCELKNVASKIIVGNVLLYGRTTEKLLDYFRTVLDILKHRHTTVKLKSANGFKIGASL